MSKLTYSFVAKIVAVFLFLILTLVFISGTVCSIFLYIRGFYYRGIDDLKVSFYEGITHDYIQQVVDAVDDLSFDTINDLQPEHTNFRYILRLSNGETLSNTYKGEKYSYRSLPRTFTVNDTDYVIEGFVISPGNAEDSYSRSDYWVSVAYSHRYTVLIFAILAFVFSVFLFVFIMCAAGRKKGSEKIHISGIEHIPYDIFIAIYALVIYAETVSFSVLYLNILFYILCFAVITVDILLLLLFCHSTAVRYKSGILFKNTVLWFLLRNIFRGLKKVFSFVKFVFLKINLFWKIFIVFSLIALIESFVFIIGANISTFELIIWLVIKAVAGVLLFVAAINVQTVKRGGEKIASGDSEHKIDTSLMLPIFRQQGDTLNNINKVITSSVNEKLKSERMKTELITNVSHDIKTPLTSIVNYVSLLKKENLKGERVNEYLDVLDRQSRRMKKLIEDLVDVSKVTTGNMTVALSETDILVLAEQACGEYSEKLEANGLELVLTKPEKTITVLADGRLLWRVFENLLNNICKYALTGTRVFLTLECKEDKVTVCFKNISKYPLNIPKNELMERFVRGDTSRNTEGSGLGLSIAKSLVELQGGSFDIFIDGDLFKATVIFNRLIKTIDESEN